MKRTLFSGIWAFTLLTVFATSAALSLAVYGRASGALREATRREAESISGALRLAGSAYAAQLEKDPQEGSVCILKAGGGVLYDSGGGETVSSGGEAAVADAWKNGSGEAAFASSLPGKRAVSCARRLSDGAVLLVTNHGNGLLLTMVSLLPATLPAAALFLLLAAVFARRKRKTAAAAISALDLENPLANDTYEELSPLLIRIQKQNRELWEKTERNNKRRAEFSAVTQHMREGMVLLDGKACVLSMNPSAMELLGAPEGDYQGKHILTVNRDLALQGLIRKAEKGESCQRLLTRDGRHCLVMAGPVLRKEEAGILLLLLDVTDKQNAEQMRREFSANVSHELKTPLTSISGYAEMIKEGLVQPRDVPEFAGRIHEEAGRLILLIEDIMKLSRLDEETARPPKEQVELLSLSRSVSERLAAQAKDAAVSLSVSGGEGTVWGARRVLEEMIYNLVDNAIKYNRPGGSVQVTVIPGEDAVSLSVKDTGIGIPQEERERVFERFYRVDKSRSKQRGGTGLGLSIVKHGAAFHGAKLEMSSKEGVGTAVRLRFAAGGRKI